MGCGEADDNEILAMPNCLPPPAAAFAVLTSDFMLLVPRRAEAVGPVSCNSVAFAGSIFVKSREEQQYVEQQGPLHILTAVGFNW
jgi:ATP adenylyltransferase/5',5'''-P-1,P-4-tetraphosphate phosphorylase II